MSPHMKGGDEARPELLSEREAYERYGDVLEDKQLRRARTSRQIGYYVLQNRIKYRADELAAYVERHVQARYHPCDSSKSESTGSIASLVPSDSTAFGMTPELEKSAAALLRQQTLKKPRSGSPRSSSRKDQGTRENQRT